MRFRYAVEGGDEIGRCPLFFPIAVEDGSPGCVRVQRELLLLLAFGRCFRHSLRREWQAGVSEEQVNEIDCALTMGGVQNAGSGQAKRA